MPTSTFDTAHLNDCLQRWRNGEREAADELLNCTKERLERLVRRMFRAFPNVRTSADVGDVLQNSMVRLLRSLRTMRPATTRDYFNLAAVHIRRELLDLARRCKSKPCVSFEFAGVTGSRHEPAVEVPADLDFWVRFHQAVDELPSEEREVVGLIFYHGWKQAQIAELFGVDERTVRRRWRRACEHLRKLVGDDCS
ncbi:RNA polymerase sigma factor [Gemmata sp. JC717]|uniref:RNA polymerase sigma factor n=1 Tax=Gemmata algarum TaxID=2975278 RepID=UPI0021BB6085|nr:RNA polymerase sigma factor [Gemmata algarum]MDY3555351.1 RNA polymerase sigma factor [Gemmata algarum]